MDIVIYLYNRLSFYSVLTFIQYNRFVPSLCSDTLLLPENDFYFILNICLLWKSKLIWKFNLQSIDLFKSDKYLDKLQTLFSVLNTTYFIYFES